MDSSNPFCNLFGNNNEPTEDASSNSDRESPINAIDQKVNSLIENIFSITINRTPQKSKQLIFMEELAAINPKKILMNMELLEQALFERLLLTNPRDYIIPNNTEYNEIENIAEEKVILYLYGAYERLTKWCRNENEASLTTECETIKQLIIRNASTALKQPELYENQSLADQWLVLLRNYADEYECKCEFLSNVVTDVANDSDNSYIESLRRT